MKIEADDIIFPMQDLCQHTLERIMLIPGMLERVELLAEENGGSVILEMDFKYGCDG